MVGRLSFDVHGRGDALPNSDPFGQTGKGKRGMGDKTGLAKIGYFQWMSRIYGP